MPWFRLLKRIVDRAPSVMVHWKEKLLCAFLLLRVLMGILWSPGKQSCEWIWIFHDLYVKLRRRMPTKRKRKYETWLSINKCSYMWMKKSKTLLYVRDEFVENEIQLWLKNMSVNNILFIHFWESTFLFEVNLKCNFLGSNCLGSSIDLKKKNKSCFW